MNGKTLCEVFMSEKRRHPMNTTSASTVRAIVRLAIRERRHRNKTPMERPSYWCHHDAFRAYLTSASIVAKFSKIDASR